MSGYLPLEWGWWIDSEKLPTSETGELQHRYILHKTTMFLNGVQVNISLTKRQCWSSVWFDFGCSNSSSKRYLGKTKMWSRPPDLRKYGIWPRTCRERKTVRLRSELAVSKLKTHLSEVINKFYWGLVYIPWHMSDWFPCQWDPPSCEHIWHSWEQRRDALRPCPVSCTLTSGEAGGSSPITVARKMRPDWHQLKLV